MSTIVAISTATGVGGIGIIRMSGENVFEILEKFFKPKKPQAIENIKGYTIKYGNIIDKNNDIIDEVLVSYFKAPKSYTTENMCEINSHGGIMVINKILDICLENGAILAEPGEFTKRAFLNGRIDLVQAESVIDIINSKTDKEVRASEEQLRGKLSKNIKDIRKDILSILADIEASIDYPEYDIEETTNEKILRFLEIIDKKLETLEKSFYNGKILREGLATAIIGRPNSGKSSLLNLILNEERAIVTDIEGTTRDTIEEYISINGIALKLIDTAGIRNAKDEVEKIGVKKSKEIAERSDVVIAMFDVSKELNEEDFEILNIIKNKNAIIVLNKVDLNRKINIKEISEIKKPIIEMSIKNEIGKEKLYNEISDMFKFNDIGMDGEVIVTNNRHKFLIKSARKNIIFCKDTISKNMPLDIISSSIKQILEDLGEITGEFVTEDIINEIFSKFCLGK
ncbi:MAG: tRNA uridine-5-carboxymethylaminomethyl(34) synthesis GTPase MnmE [Clostridia bacterium]|nr:tRNA uridine-5-carboxymethylaminomethyl(34) synthesis GTPase MnmE [Clostridia bacterium]